MDGEYGRRTWVENMGEEHGRGSIWYSCLPFLVDCWTSPIFERSLLKFRQTSRFCSVLEELVDSLERKEHMPKNFYEGPLTKKVT